MSNNHHEVRLARNVYAFQTGSNPRKSALVSAIKESLPALSKSSNWTTFTRNVTKQQMQILLGAIADAFDEGFTAGWEESEKNNDV